MKEILKRYVFGSMRTSPDLGRMVFGWDLFEDSF
jgi:hypothetical protein